MINTNSTNFKITSIDFEYPENLVAQHPASPSRVMHVHLSSEQTLIDPPVENSIEQILSKISSNDVLVLNNTKVLKRRVFALDGAEILFLEPIVHNDNDRSDEPIRSGGPSRSEWTVLFPAKKYKIGEQIALPGGVHITLQEKGRPQRVISSEPLMESYFLQYGELPLPPYIQKARHERHNQQQDEFWYQTVWAKKPGSFAAPTASFHFKEHHLETLKSRGVKILEVTLHVGLGTFLPVEVENLAEHKMHFEQYEVHEEVWQDIQTCKQEGGRVWGLGTTVVRTLESVAKTKQLSGSTDLLILPGYEFQVVDVLMTNFHQPRSTLIALVMAFAGQSSVSQSSAETGVEKVKLCYRWAIEKGFRLFSYGDLTVWERPCGRN